MTSALPRRILMTADAVGGVFTYAVDLIRNLGVHGIETTLAILGPPPSRDQMQAAQRSGAIGISLMPGKLEWMADPWRDVEARKEQLLELAVSCGAELVHLNDYSSALLPFQIPTVVVGHSCVYSWFAAVRRCAPPDDYRYYYRNVQRSLQAATVVTAPTAAMLHALSDVYGSFPSAAPIPNAKSAASHDFGRKCPFVLTAGRLWDEAKNAAALDEAAPGLSWPVIAAGPVQSPTEDTPRFLNLTLTGALPRERLAYLYEQAAIFALPARYEPFGLCVLEAALAGCALVLGDIPSLRELWQDCALFVPSDDPASLRRAIEQLAQDAELRQQLSAASRQRAERFRPSAQVDAYVGLYTNVLRSGSAGRPSLNEACVP